MTGGRFTGRHMALAMAGFFGVVFTVNLLMARLAHATFGGVVVENSYVASQQFNRWLGEAKAEDALGWDARLEWRADRHLAVTLAGVPEGARVQAMARHPLGRLPDRVLRFASAGDNHYISSDALPAGRWQLRLDVQSGGKSWRQERELR